ncbi:Cloroperoxidase [Mycena kentingensis (nom. inval.)]|nr:Cloroperoxidase [Mycena kentingensis (nom. inval.)]
MRLLICLALPSLLALAAATDIQDGQTGVPMSLPPQPTDTSLKRIPDAAHPFKAPGPDDQRGPCPAMNTLANHGYIPRNGVASFEELMNGMMEAFNLPQAVAAVLAANNFLSRGNVFINKLSIGGVTPLVPPLPGKIDGPTTRGIAAHGRFEGDASITRQDAFIGDNRDFQDILYDLALLQLGKFGGDGPDGNNTVFNIQTFIAISAAAIERDQAANAQFTLNPSRLAGVAAADSFILDVFANGTTKLATLPIVGSFFRNQTFPDNWFRTNGVISAETITADSNTIRAGLSAPGRNNADGVFVLDPPAPAPWNSSFACTSYWDQNGHIASTLAGNLTGIFKQNVEFLLNITFETASAAPGCTQPVAPFGEPGI